MCCRIWYGLQERKERTSKNCTPWRSNFMWIFIIHHLYGIISFALPVRYSYIAMLGEGEMKCNSGSLFFLQAKNALYIYNMDDQKLTVLKMTSKPSIQLYVDRRCIVKRSIESYWLRWQAIERYWLGSHRSGWKSINEGSRWPFYKTCHSSCRRLGICRKK